MSDTFEDGFPTDHSRERDTVFAPPEPEPTTNRGNEIPQPFVGQSPPVPPPGAAPDALGRLIARMDLTLGEIKRLAQNMDANATALFGQAQALHQEILMTVKRQDERIGILERDVAELRRLIVSDGK